MALLRSYVNNASSLNVKSLAADTCDIVVIRFGITKANFVVWNPSVGSDCSGFVGGTSYCVRGSKFEPYLA